MALPSGTYAPRDPAASVLYQVVRDHYHTFRAEASQIREGEGLPRFVDDEFDAFLRCGWLPPHHAQPAWRGPRARRWVRALSLHELPRGAARGLLVQGPRICGVLEYAESWGVEAGDVEGFQAFALIRGAIDFA